MAAQQHSPRIYYCSSYTLLLEKLHIESGNLV